MAETQRVASVSRPAPKPRPRHPTRYNPPLRPGLDEAHEPRPQRAAPPPAKPAAATATPASEARPSAPIPRRRLPPRSPAERVILAVLVVGLGLNVAALVTSPHLSGSDLLLGGTVLFAGLILLILIELCRRSAPPADETD